MSITQRGPVPPNQPPFPTIPSKAGGIPSLLGTSPGLLTSTGGIFGIDGVLLAPVQNYVNGNSYVLLMNSQDFNCEEDAEYDFPQEIPKVQNNPFQEGCIVNCHLIKLKYREIGYAKFTVSVTSYNRDTDTFTTYPYIVNIPSKPFKNKVRKASFPDNKIHTIFIPIDVPGERPQVTLTSKGDSGPYSITSLSLCGLADEEPQI